MTSVGTYWRTLRHLRPVQLMGRVRQRVYRPGPKLAAAPPLTTACGRWIPGAQRGPSLVGPRRLRFLGVEHTLGTSDWDNPALSRLWRYNLHYFDDLNARDAAQRRDAQRALVDGWIAENPPGHGSGWEPYPVSLRIVNWIKWALGGEALAPHVLHSLAVQARWLRDRIEIHLLGNHLFANAKALVFAGLFFDGPEAREWLAIGLSIIGRELDEQILPDGGHFERSPMYHALALEDLLDLIDVAQALAPAGTPAAVLTQRLRLRVPAMQRWLQTMTHPDGTLGMFNDCAMDIAPDRTELDRFAGALGLPPPAQALEGATHLSPSGYVRLSLGSATALLDVAPVGPDYLPGHAHADTLSFELSLHRERVVVNGGTSCYGEGAQRSFERSTQAHSTVLLGGVDSSEVWAGFRVGRRARPVGLELQVNAPPWQVTCGHDGYRHLPGQPQHVRSWRMLAGELVVTDEVRQGPAQGLARYLIAPGVTITPDGPGRWQLQGARGPLGTVDVLRGQASIEPARATTRFGELAEASCLVVALEEGQAVTRWRWDDNAYPVPD